MINRIIFLIAQTLPVVALFLFFPPKLGWAGYVLGACFGLQLAFYERMTKPSDIQIVRYTNPRQYLCQMTARKIITLSKWAILCVLIVIGIATALSLMPGILMGSKIIICYFALLFITNLIYLHLT